MKKITYHTHKAEDMFEVTRNKSGVFKKSHSSNQINECKFPYNIDFCINKKYLSDKKNFKGSGIYLIEFKRELIYIGKFRPYYEGNIIMTRWRPHLETLTNRGSRVGGFEKTAGEKTNIFKELKGCEISSLEGRKRDTGTVTSKARIKFAKDNWDLFSGDINKLRDSLKEFTFYYFQLNEVFSFKKSQKKQEKELYGDLTSLIEEYLLIKYSTKCNSGYNGLTKISDIKITDIKDNIIEFVDFLNR
ncbi:MAG: hypothetical protein CMD02_00490 [Flavobacteriales bacterium]|nr:hypothetical protein [Flavobacteriales bacterium]|tara:strand:- start:3953 stop:4690 length:738 start_codon:yes stop_codon:yes gene_type:complete